MPCAILVPSLNRPQNLRELVANIHANTPEEHFILFAVSDDESKAILDELDEWYLDDSDTDDRRYVTRMNKLVRHIDDAKTVFFGSDDVRHHMGWLSAGIQAMLDQDKACVVVNDMTNPAGTQGLMRSDFIPLAVVDSPGDAFHSGYLHNFADNEMWLTTQRYDQYGRAEHSVVEHLHPLYQKSNALSWDETYRHAMEGWKHDEDLFRERSMLIRRATAGRGLTVDVVVPATRPSVRALAESLRAGSRSPDSIIVVSNELTADEVGPGVTLVRFSSDTQPVGRGDAGLRRDIGADISSADVVVFLDDDVIAPRDMLLAALEVVERDGFCWGHYRYIDFDEIPMATLLDMPPERGRSREHGVNRWHGWQSSYGGMFAIRRDLFWEVGGFDLGFLGVHANEDQQLGRRLSGGTLKTYVHEPPFAWHPENDVFHSVPKTNIMGAHWMVRTAINGMDFFVCEECPCRKPVDVDSLTRSERVIIPYSRSDFSITKERL